MQALLAAACVLATTTGAAPRVVGNEACATHAVDIESFASCDGDRVAGSENDLLSRSEWLSEDRVPPSKRNGVGLYVDAARAYQLRRDYPQLVVLVDIRSRLEVELAAAERPACAVPGAVAPAGMGRRHQRRTWCDKRVCSRARGRLQALGFGWRHRDPALLLGEEARAATSWHYAIERSASSMASKATSGRRPPFTNGWKNAGLPTARAAS
jgi:hypothetical protein